MMKQWHPLLLQMQQGMDEEITALQNNDTSELTSRPKDIPIIGGRWVYAVLFIFINYYLP